jgi:predicted dehydrogenase
VALKEHELGADSSAPLRFGVVGVGQRGGAYARALASGRVPGAVLEAVCDVRREALEPFQRHACFDDARALVHRATLDAVVVATPHRMHEEPTALGLSAGLHVLTEKPLAVHVKRARDMIRDYERRAARSQLFATALVLRADPRFLLLKKLLEDGTLGRVQRIAWTVTDCFRSEAYYRSAEWRGSFRGEGGGLLVNQCSHQLDLWQWLFGMPARVCAFLGLGRFHSIEVEDEVSAFLEYADGATGVFVASTGEAPGTNRLEVAGERGKVVVEGDAVELWRNQVSTPDRIRTEAAREKGPTGEHERIVLPIGGLDGARLLQNFVGAIRGHEPLLAPAAEGLASVELATALLQAGLTGRTVELPLENEAHPSAVSEPVRS